MQNRNRLAPIALAAEQPVAQAVGYFAFAAAFFFEPGDHFCNSFLIVQTIQEIRIHMRAVAAVSLFFYIAALHHFKDFQAELLGEFPVAGVMSRHRHNGSRSVTCEHIIRDPDRHLSAIHRVNRVCPSEDTGFLLGQIRTLKVTLAGSFITVFRHCRFLLFCRNEIHQLMLRCQHTVACAEQGIRTGGEYLQAGVMACNGEGHFSSGRFADPVALHILDAFFPVQLFQILEQTFRVLRNFQNPLAHRSADHRMAPALAFAVDDLFVRQHCSQGFTPVDRYLCHIGQTTVVQLDKNPLCPFVIFRIGCADLAVPVIGEAQRFDLAAEIINVLKSNLARMLSGIHCILLSRKSEGIPAHRVQHVVAAHPLVAGDDIRRRVAFRVSYMQPCA
ncbi:hypothetical protein D3C76_584890 [compost metagenome]